MREVDGQRIAEIGDGTPDGMLVIADTAWDSNGTLRVTVRLLGRGSDFVGGFPLRRARRLARRAIMHPEKTRSARVLRTFTAGGCDFVTFAVSRLEG